MTRLHLNAGAFLLLGALLAAGMDPASGAEAGTTPQPKAQATVVADSKWSDGIKESDGKAFSCPGNKVMIGRKHSGDENGTTNYRCGTVKQFGLPTTTSSHAWSSEFKESSHNFAAPCDRVFTGRKHEGDENGETTYQHAMVKDYLGNTLRVVPDAPSQGETVKESSHEFTCPTNKVLLQRAHSGDENGDTTYWCGTLW